MAAYWAPGSCRVGYGAHGEVVYVFDSHGEFGQNGEGLKEAAMLKRDDGRVCIVVLFWYEFTHSFTSSVSRLQDDI